MYIGIVSKKKKKTEENVFFRFNLFLISTNNFCTRKFDLICSFLEHCKKNFM